MDVKKAQELTEKTLAAKDIQQYLEKLIADVDTGIEKAAIGGNWKYKHGLTETVANYDLLDQLYEHYLNKGFEIELATANPKFEENVFHYNNAEFIVSWNRKIKDIKRSDNVERTESESAAKPPTGPRPRKGGTPMVAPSEEGRDRTDLQGVSLDERRAASAA